MVSVDQLIVHQSSFFSTSTLAALLTILLLIFSRIKKGLVINNNRLHGLPGPRQYFLGSWLNLWELATHRDWIKVVSKWCNNVQGSSLMKVNAGPVSTILLLSPENVQKIYGSADMKYLEKPQLLQSLAKPVSWFDSVVLSKGEKWKTRRKLIVSRLSYNSLLNYIHPMNVTSRTLVTKLETMFESGKDSEIQDILFHSTFRTLCSTVFGIVGQADYDRYDCDGFIRMTERTLTVTMERVRQPWLLNDLIFRLHPKSKKVDSYYRQSRQFIEQIVQEHMDGNLEKPSLIREFVTAGLTLDAIYEEVLTMFIGGYETTGNALHYLFFLLALNPEHQEQCRNEVDSLLENTDICLNGDFSVESLKKMSYLEQCVMETLRMLSPSSGYARILGASVTLDDNTVLPRGTIATVFVPGIHMNPKYYPNPEQFEPSRFSPEERRQRSPYTFLPFSVGPRGCPANKYAMNEILIIAARVLRHFEITTNDKLEEIVFLSKIAMTPEIPMKFLFKKRVPS